MSNTIKQTTVLDEMTTESLKNSVVNEEIVKRFLYEEFGYKKVCELISGRKDKNISMKDFFNNTIIGTIGNQPGINKELSKTLGKPHWKSKYIMVPQIYKMSELEEQIEKGKYYLTTINDKKELFKNMQNHEYFLSSFLVFTGKQPTEIENIFYEIKNNYFPNDELFFNKNKRIKAELVNTDLAIFSEGSIRRSGSKGIAMTFNIDKATYEHLTNAVKRYHGMMKYFSSKK
jgi:hypothetical protein